MVVLPVDNVVSVVLHEGERGVVEGEYMEVGAGIQSAQALPAADGVATEVQHSETGQGGPEIVLRYMLNLGRRESFTCSTGTIGYKYSTYPAALSSELLA